MSFSVRNESRRTPIAEINVTPLVDVVLVLLIIFMVTAPFLQGGLDMREGLALTIEPGGRIVLDKTPVKLADLGQALEEKGAASRPVYLRADQRVPYGLVAQVIGRARAAGVTQLGLVTEPDERPRR